jgi:hypothetical protein
MNREERGVLSVEDIEDIFPFLERIIAVPAPAAVICYRNLLPER